MLRALMKRLPAGAFLAILGGHPAGAIELESDLSTHYVEIRTNFQGAELLVFGAVTDRPAYSNEPVDLIVVVRGPPQTVEIRRKAHAGFVWANAESIAARDVPSFYSIASTKPIDEIADNASLERYKIGFDHLAIGFDARLARRSVPPGNPPANLAGEPLPSAEPFAVAAAPADGDIVQFRQALTRLLETRHRFRADGRLTFIRSNLFRAEIEIPATVPAGQYGAEVFLLQNKAILGATYMVFSIDKKGLEGDIYGLAHDTPLTYGFLAVMIAAIAGWASELVFRRR